MTISQLKDLWESQAPQAIGINPMYPTPQPQPCPSCGYCPHCGRGGHHATPYYPPYGPVWM